MTRDLRAGSRTPWRHVLVFALATMAMTFKSVRVRGEEREIADPLRMVMPAEVHAAVGIETNIYFDNLVLALNSANYAFDVTSPKGQQQAERWTWTPTSADVGDTLFQLEVRDEQNRIVSTGTTVMRVVNAGPVNPPALSLLLVGDSLTHASVYSQYLLDLSKKLQGSPVTLIGSHEPKPELPGNRHEGYGGWTALRFATHFTETARQGEYAKRGSPFLYRQQDGTTKLDFQRYCADVNQGKFPDAVTIFLGPNDIFSFNDATIADGIQNMLKHLDQLIAMVHSASPTTRVGILLPVPPAASQDAFGSNYGSGQTRWQYRRNQHALVEAMMKRYGQRQPERIDLIATHANLDCRHNYPSAAMTPNVHAEQQIVRQNNGVHPSAAGYRQIGDSVFAWLSSLPRPVAK